MSQLFEIDIPGITITEELLTALLVDYFQKLKYVIGDVSVRKGSWPKNDPRRAFVDGAKWWEFTSTKFTMWTSDIERAEKEAERRYSSKEGPTPEAGDRSSAGEG